MRFMPVVLEGVTVRVRSERMQATDGPYVETKEHPGGVHSIDAPGRSDVAAWAARGSSARVIGQTRAGQLSGRPLG